MAADDSKLKPGAQDALIIVDVQNDFCPGGRLAVQKGDEVVSLVNELSKRFENVVLTQDWHPPGHQSFATSHPGSKPFDSIKLAYGEQMLWPDHCVQGSDGAALHRDLAVPCSRWIRPISRATLAIAASYPTGENPPAAAGSRWSAAVSRST